MPVLRKSAAVRESWTLQRTAGPTQLPVTLEEVKRNLRLAAADTTHDDDLTLKIEAAVEMVEQDIDRAIINQAFLFSSYQFPTAGGVIQLPVKPISSVESIHYLDSEGADTLWPADQYTLKKASRQVYPNYGNQWPSAARYVDSVRVAYTAGYGAVADAVPRAIKQMILLWVGYHFSNPVDGWGSDQSIQTAYERLRAQLEPTWNQ